MDTDIRQIILKKLETQKYIYLSSLGGLLKGKLPDGTKLKYLLMEYDEFKILEDPKIKERIAVCKKDDNEAEASFFKSDDSLALISDKPKFIRSLLNAFQKDIPDGKKIIIEKQAPFKYKVVTAETKADGWIELDKKYMNSTGDSISSNIEEWATTHGIDIEDILFKKRNMSDNKCLVENELIKFISIQPKDIQDRIVFPASFLKAFLSK